MVGEETRVGGACGERCRCVRKKNAVWHGREDRGRRRPAVCEPTSSLQQCLYRVMRNASLHVVSCLLVLDQHTSYKIGFSLWSILMKTSLFPPPR